MAVRIDYTNVLDERVGANGIELARLKKLKGRAERAIATLRARFEKGELGFAELPQGKELARAATQYAKKRAGKYDDVIVLGIGGSALGARAVHEAVNGEFYNTFASARSGGRPRLFILDNIDPEPLAQVFSEIDAERTLVNVITKSGSTAETMAGLLTVDELMRAKGKKAARQNVVVTTDPEKGDLRQIAQQEGYATFDVPANVGGRFSVLSAVGLLPLAFTGVDLAKLLGGARAMSERCWNPKFDENPAAVTAAIEYLLDTERGKTIQVLFPYTNALKSLAAWYCQLWAESLGKAVDRKGKKAGVGQTPVVALGATDQHSQLQLFMEGPNDKAFSFWVVDEFRAETKIGSRWEEFESTGYLGGQTFNKLIAAEQRAVERALAEAGRPSLTYRIERVDEHSVGELIALFEFQTAIAGELYDIDAFDQPGVEAGKRATYALMGRAGYESLAEEIEASDRAAKRRTI